MYNINNETIEQSSNNMILYFKNKLIRFNLIASILLNILLWLFFYLRIPIISEPIALRYNIYVGINLIGPWWQVYYFSLAGLLIILVNFFLAKKIFLKNKILAYFLASISTLCQIFLLIYGILIVLINS